MDWLPERAAQPISVVIAFLQSWGHDGLVVVGLPQAGMASSGKRSAAARRARQRSSAQPASGAIPEVGRHDLIARCHAIAEDLNGRGDFDLAVPFYRQTIALLLADQPVGEVVADEAASAVQEVNRDVVQVDTLVSASEPLSNELNAHLLALEEDLSTANALTVQCLLLDLQAQRQKQCAPLLALLAKTHLLQGDLQAALLCYQQALKLNPQDSKLIVNTAAACLAIGDFPMALKHLRPLARHRHTLKDPRVVRSLLSNLALAELESGHVAEAALLRAELAGMAPDALPLQDWVDDARRWVEQGHRMDAKGLLVALRAVHPCHRGVLELLAQLLEELGEYRDAALVYRDLLRPNLAGS